jgi:DNA-binding MarR family transcriptional regulator
LSTPVKPAQHSSQAPQAEQVAEQLRSIIGTLVRKVRGEAQTPSSAQSETLGFIDRNGPASISEMAAFRHVKHQSMRLVIDQLESQGLVERAPDPADGRKKLISLTDLGRVTLAQQRNQRSQWLADRLQQKTTTAELQTLSDALHILERLVADDEAGPSR